MRQLAAESLFLQSTHSEKTAEYMLDRSDFWAVVMRGRPTPADPPSLPDSRSECPQVKETPNEHVQTRPRRNPPRATKPQEQEPCPSLPDSRPKRPAEDEAPGEHRPKWRRVYRPRDPVGACPYSRPLLPTRELIVEAILSAPDKQMCINDIKQYLQSHYPWFTWGSARSNVTHTIRQALGATRPTLKRFEEVPEQQGYWRVRAEYLRYLGRTPQ